MKDTLNSYTERELAYIRDIISNAVSLQRELQDTCDYIALDYNLLLHSCFAMYVGALLTSTCKQA